MEIATRAEAPDFTTGNSQLLMDYRKALLEAYKLGEEIKEVYGVVPPKVISEKICVMNKTPNHLVIGLTVN